ncbi:YfhO family protein [Myxococcus sp. AS-1-15]|uniref:YfhO family protein n=1 Tax=Myxococcus sp. AS-1-15 TaxID=2874600 RepID=UPI001CC0FD3F|nr:YfhO family protein [Myxococcus sp. AS-1-15]MBZ4401206.1 YfhO family protein [Myxococcus sp. AS-1-15]
MPPPASPEPAAGVRVPIPRPAWAVVGGALALTCLFFYRAVFSAQVFIARDMLLVYAPLRRYWAQRVLGGDFPGWYPFDGLGQSFAGIMLSAPFHPSQLLGLLFSTGVAMKLTVLACPPLALLGTYALLRLYDVPRGGAFFGGLAFAFSGHLVSLTNNLAYLLAAASLPAALWAAERFLRAATPARAAVAAFGVASVLLAGDTWSYAFANAFVLLLAVTGRGALRTRVLRALGLVAMGAGLAAPQLFAGMAVFAHGAPGASSLEDAQRWSLDPWRLPELVLGPYLANPAVERAVPEEVVKPLLSTGGFSTLWTDSALVGAPVLVLAVTGLMFIPWRRWAPFAAVWGLVLLLALGAALPVYGWLHDVLPLWRPFRYPEKLVAHLTLGLSLLAGFGWKALVSSEPRARRAAWVAGGLSVGLLAVALAERWGAVWSSAFVVARWPQVPAETLETLSHAFSDAGFIAAGLALGCALVLPGLAGSWPRAGVLMALQLGAAFTLNEPLYILGSEELLDSPPTLVEAVREHAARTGDSAPRVSSRLQRFQLPQFEGFEFQDSVALMSRASLMPDTPALWNIGAAGAYLPAVSARVKGLQLDAPARFTQLEPLYGVRFSVYTSASYAGLEPKPGRVFARDEVFELVLVEHADALPRLFVARPRCVSDEKAALGLLGTEAFRQGTWAAVECGVEPLPASSEAPLTGRVLIERDTPEHLVVSVESSEDAVLIVNDAFQAGWTASVDGVPTRVLPANGAVRAVAVPSGRHQVVLRYRAPGVLPGLLLWGVTLVGLALAEGWRRRRSPALR